MGSPGVDDPAVEDRALTTELPAAGASTDKRRRIRAVAFAAVLIAALAVTAAVVLATSSSPKAGAKTGLAAGETTTTVTRRTLTESATLSGTLGYGGSLEIYDRLTSAGTFTWLPAVGAVIGRGGTLYRVNNLPVVLMYGSVPAYRALKQGVSDGPDVSELNRNLISLGYDPYGAISDYEHFGEAAAAAVRRWQKAEGLSQTGEVELGRVAFASGPQRVTKLHVALGQDPPGSESPSAAEEPAAKKPAAAEEPAAEEPAAKKPAAKKPAAKKPAAKEPAAKEPAAKKPTAKKPAAKKPSSGENASKEAAAKEAASKEPNSGGGAGTVVLSTTSTQQLVQLSVKASQQQLAHVGESAPVTLPDGEVVHGHVTGVGTVATESSEAEKEKGAGGGGGSGGSGENATISVTLKLDHRVTRLDQAPVSVSLVKSTRRNVLTVPATALVATAGGGYALDTLEGDRRVAMPVSPGMFADGYVEVEGAGIHEGITVIEAG